MRLAQAHGKSGSCFPKVKYSNLRACLPYMTNGFLKNTWKWRPGFARANAVLAGPALAPWGGQHYQMKLKWGSNTVFFCCLVFYARKSCKRPGREGQKTLRQGILRRHNLWGVLHSLSLRSHLHAFQVSAPIVYLQLYPASWHLRYYSGSLFPTWLGSSLELGFVLVQLTTLSPGLDTE